MTDAEQFVKDYWKSNPPTKGTLTSWIAAFCEAYHKSKIPNPGDLGGLLFGIHHHHPKSEKIIYYEDELIELLKSFGFPEPVWGKVIKMGDWKPEVTDTLEKDEGGLG